MILDMHTKSKHWRPIGFKKFVSNLANEIQASASKFKCKSDVRTAEETRFRHHWLVHFDPRTSASSQPLSWSWFHIWSMQLNVLHYLQGVREIKSDGNNRYKISDDPRLIVTASPENIAALLKRKSFATRWCKPPRKQLHEKETAILSAMRTMYFVVKMNLLN